MKLEELYPKLLLAICPRHLFASSVPQCATMCIEWAAMCVECVAVWIENGCVQLDRIGMDKLVLHPE